MKVRGEVCSRAQVPGGNERSHFRELGLRTYPADRPTDLHGPAKIERDFPSILHLCAIPATEGRGSVPDLPLRSFGILRCLLGR